MRTPEEQADFDFLVVLVDAAERRARAQGIEALNEADATLLAVWRLEAEVNNGGFDQYFFNGSGDMAHVVVPALVRIGARQCAEIVRRAMEVFGDSGPAPDREERAAQLEALGAEEAGLFADLDAAFFGYPEPLEELLVAYARGK